MRKNLRNETKRSGNKSMKRDYHTHTHTHIYNIVEGWGTNARSCSQTNDNRETPTDILEPVNVLYKYSVHNEYVVWRWEGRKHMSFKWLAHTNLNAIIMADVQIVNSTSASTS